MREPRRQYAVYLGHGVYSRQRHQLPDHRSHRSGHAVIRTAHPGAGSDPPQFGYLTATFNGQTLNMSFIDSGSNGIYFNDTGIVQCTDPNYSQYYCPAGTLDLTVTLQGADGATGEVGFSVGNAQNLETNNPAFVVLPALAGTNPLPASFDFGLPFYFGRRVATALENSSTSLGTGPYVAY